MMKTADVCVHGQRHNEAQKSLYVLVLSFGHLLICCDPTSKYTKPLQTLRFYSPVLRAPGPA